MMDSSSGKDDDDFSVGTIIIISVAGGGLFIVGIFLCAFLLATMLSAREHTIVYESLKQKK